MFECCGKSEFYLVATGPMCDFGLEGRLGALHFPNGWAQNFEGGLECVTCGKHFDLVPECDWMHGLAYLYKNKNRYSCCPLTNKPILRMTCGGTVFWVGLPTEKSEKSHGYDLDLESETEKIVPVTWVAYVGCYTRGHIVFRLKELRERLTYTDEPLVF